ncbi:MAG: ATP-binding protein [Bacteroidetes bacterium]|nr:ATP-binding protein [Bacteroidota bacterium]
MTIEEIFDKITTTEIDRYINDQQEENLTLEFQTVNYPGVTGDTKNYDLEMLSRALSGFANSSGGIIIWGVFVKKDDNGVGSATRKNPIKDLGGFIDFLNEAMDTIVSPPIVGVKHRKIEEERDIGYAATYVPPSNNVPHMANFKKLYFKRSGAKFYRCEHFDITDMFARKQNPKLELIVFGATSTGTGSGNSYTIVFGLSNAGKSVAKYPMLRISVNEPYKFGQFGLGGSMSTGMEKGQDQGDGYNTYLAERDQVIYPGIVVQVDQVEIDVDAESKQLPPLKIEYSTVAEGMALKKETMTYKFNI